jgi:peptide/nickel transport system substrate-binding protein
MKLRSYLYPAIVSAIALAGFRAAERPRYGGTLRVEVGASVASLDPSQCAANAAEASAKIDLLPLVFETLAVLDANGLPQPGLASSWDHDPRALRWNFHLRPGVRFHDGSPLTPSAAVSALSNVDPSWHVSSSSDAVSIETSTPAPDLPFLLAEPRHALARRADDGTIVGTGLFRITLWQVGKHVVFSANPDYWAGRPFLDSVDVTMGTAPQARTIDLQLGKADLVDLPPDMVRRAADDKLRVGVTVPTELLALVFQTDRKTVQDARVREALARSIDRAAIVNFILQKQGEAVASLLPEWLSGTASLFSASADPDAAHSLWEHIKPTPALVLGYDSGEALEQSIAERITVNARAAGISIATRAIPAAARPGDFDARLVRLRMSSPEPREALSDILGALPLVSSEDTEPLPNPASAEEIYVRERAALDGFRVVPLVHLPRAYGVGNRVRNWEIRAGNALGGWQLGDVWIEGEAQ